MCFVSEIGVVDGGVLFEMKPLKFRSSGLARHHTNTNEGTGARGSIIGAY